MAAPWPLYSSPGPPTPGPVPPQPVGPPQPSASSSRGKNRQEGWRSFRSPTPLEVELKSHTPSWRRSHGKPHPFFGELDSFPTFFWEKKGPGETHTQGGAWLRRRCGWERHACLEGINELPILASSGKGLGVPASRGAPWPGLSRVPTDDFVLLLCAAQQWRVFEAERSEPWLQAAGDNSDRLDRERDRYNPTRNFIYCKWVPPAQHPDPGWGRGNGIPWGR